MPDAPVSFASLTDQVVSAVASATEAALRDIEGDLRGVVRELADQQLRALAAGRADLAAEARANVRLVLERHRVRLTGAQQDLLRAALGGAAAVAGGLVSGGFLRVADAIGTAAEALGNKTPPGPDARE